MTKWMKKTVSVISVLALLLGVLCTTAFAANNTHTITIVHHYNMATVLGGSLTNPSYVATENTAHAMDGTDGYPDLTYTETFTVSDGGSVTVPANNHPDGLANTAYSDYNFTLSGWAGATAGGATVQPVYPNNYVVAAYSAVAFSNVTRDITVNFAYRQNYTPIWVYLVLPDGSQQYLGAAVDTVPATIPGTGCVREWNSFTFHASDAAAAVGVDLSDYQIAGVTSLFASTRLNAEQTALAGTTYDAATGILSGVNVSNQDFNNAYGDGTTNYTNYVWITLKDISYTVTYDFNGGIYNNSTDALVQDVSAGASSQLIADPTRTGYTFDGWTVTTDNSAISAPAFEENDGVKSFTMPAANVTLTANWTLEEEEIVDDAPPLSGPTDPNPETPEDKPVDKPVDVPSDIPDDAPVVVPVEEEILDDSTPLSGPNTGDTAPIALFVAAGVISLAAVIALIAKRKGKEEQ